MYQMADSVAEWVKGEAASGSVDRASLGDDL